MHSDSQLGHVWVVLSSDFEVSTIDHDVIGIESFLFIHIDIVGFEDKRTIHDDKSEAGHLRHIDEQVASFRNLNCFTLERWEVTAPSLSIAPARDISVEESSSSNITETINKDVKRWLLALNEWFV